MLPPTAQRIPDRFADTLAEHADPAVRAAYADPRIHAAAVVVTQGREIRSAGYFAQVLRDLAKHPEKVRELLSSGGQGGARGAQGRTSRPVCYALDRDERWEHPAVLLQECDRELAAAYDGWDDARQGEVLCAAIEDFERRARNDRGTGALDRWGRVDRFERPENPADDLAAAEAWVAVVRTNSVFCQDFAEVLRRTIRRSRPAPAA